MNERMLHAMRSRCALLMLLLCCADARAAEPPVRGEFSAALVRAESGALDDAGDSPALRAYLLYPYLEAARLSQALQAHPDEALDARIATALKSGADLPPLRELRHRWLLSLAQRQRWSEFLGNVDDRDTDADTALQCSRFQAWIDTDGCAPCAQDACTSACGGRSGLRDDVLKVWMTGAQLPQSCVAPFEWLRAQGALTPPAHEQRARLALAAGNPDLAEWLLRAAPPEHVAPLLRWAHLQQSPQKELPLLFAERAAVIDADALLDVWTRLAKNQPGVARPLLPALAASRRLTPLQLAMARSAVALGLAWNRDPATIALFRDIPDEALDDAGHEWRVRSALRAGNWRLAAEWLHRMPPALAADPRWSYWRARSLEVLGSKQGRTIYRTLTQDNGYFGALAAWRLHERFTPTSHPLPADAAVQAAVAGRPAIQRARELLEIERDDWAATEWRAALKELGDAERVQAARLAASWGWYIQAVPALAGLNKPDDLELLYPDAFADVIESASKQSSVPAPWIYGVMRQESLFMPRAVSSSNAIGLLQLLLPTAREVAARQKMPRPTREDLMRPPLNAALGAAYLHDMLERFDGRLAPALAGYNAGPNATARWIPPQPMDADVWIENIPINQTRAYVARIIWHIVAHGWRVSGEPQDPAPLLLPVGGAPERP